MKIISFKVLISIFSFLNIVQAQDGLVGHWSFDEISGDTIYDQSLYGNHGTNYGAEIILGALGNALYFNGESDYARIPGDGQAPPSILAGLGHGSISVWFRIDHIPTDYGIAPIFYYGAEDQCNFFDAANQGLIIEIGHSPIHFGSERLYFTIWKNGCTYPSFCYDSNDPISTGIWHHFVAVVGSTYNTGYLDGHLMSNRRYNFGNAQYSQFFEDARAHEKLWLGKGYWDQSTQYFEGAIDDLRIYSKALTWSEVLGLYNLTGLNSLLPLSSDIKVYPNPTSEILYYELPEFDTNIEAIVLRDVTGKIIDQSWETGNGKGLNIGGLPDGIYFIELNTGEKAYRQKFVVKH